ncbi:MAG: CoA transferase, partial [Advenella sp.]
LLSLLVQARTGKGRHVNLSQVECMLPLVAPFIVEQSVCGKTTPRNGNLHPIFAPHGVYPCAGDDEWLVLSVTNDTQWRTLANVIDAHHLGTDSSLNQVEGRRSQQQQIDAHISTWSKQRSADSAMRELQLAGVAAGVVKPVWRVLDDPHLNDRGFFKKIARPYLGEYLATTPWFRETVAPTQIVHPAPTLGEHSREVFSRVLGMTQEQQQALEDGAISGTSATRKTA